MSVVAPTDRSGREDRILVLRGATWADWRRMQRQRGDKSAPRLAYLEGALEIMNPSRDHESIKSKIGCLVEMWCLEAGLEFSTYGSWTIEDESVERGVKADECYVFGRVDEPERPDLAIAVAWTSGGIDKLEIYRGLGVREVWFWRRGVLTPWVLRGDAYEAVERSEVLPELDLPELASFIDRSTTSEAIRAYREVIVRRRARK